MSVTTTGAQFKAFYNDPKVWGIHNSEESWYVEDMFVMVNGKDVDMDAVHDEHGGSFERLPDDAKVKIETGYLCWQGKGPAPQVERPLVQEFKKWAKARDVVSVIASFELPVAWTDAQRAKVVDVLEALGAKGVTGATGSNPDVQEREALQRVLGQIVGVDLAAAPEPKRKRSASPR